MRDMGESQIVVQIDVHHHIHDLCTVIIIGVYFFHIKRTWYNTPLIYFVNKDIAELPQVTEFIFRSGAWAFA